jgi:hypothetical protein
MLEKNRLIDFEDFINLSKNVYKVIKFLKITNLIYATNIHYDEQIIQTRQENKVPSDRKAKKIDCKEEMEDNGISVYFLFEYI